MQRRFAAMCVVAVLALAGVMALAVTQSGTAEGLVPFGDYSRLYAYLDRVNQGGYGGNGSYATMPVNGGTARGPWAPADGYSGTNVQVAGIDELDTVKTDGAYVYLASGSEVAIVDARTPSALAVVARVPAAADPEANLSRTYVSGIFLAEDRLVVVASEYAYYPGIYRTEPAPGAPTAGLAAPVYGMGGSTHVSTYGLADPSHPILQDALRVTGAPLTGRMIAPYVYLVLNEPVIRVNATYELPASCSGETCAPLPADAIYYDPSSVEAGSFTNLVALDVRTGEEKTVSVVTGYTSTVYMSPAALYLTYTKWSGSAVPVAFAGDAVSVSSTSGTWTTIHKVSVAGLEMTPVAHGDVPGTLLNQFSLDEDQGYLRVFTSEWSWSGNASSQANDLSILDGSMTQVGALRGIAPGEYIRSARFMGDRAYLVTFVKTDPLFVIDVSDPTAPQVLGELKIPGYSDYLHPIDEDHILGIGKNAVNATEGDFAWYQGLKIALFNVSDVSHPVQTNDVVLGDRGTDSDVLSDHKAFLSIPSRGLVVIPVALAQIDTSQWGNPPPAWAYGEVVWQGAYVFHVDVSDGVTIVGRVTQQNGTPDPYNGTYLDYNRYIRRSLYIGDTLFTVSATVLQANALADLSYVDAVEYAT